MSKIKSLDEIKSVKVHWSESNTINEALGHDDNCDIEKFVDVNELDKLIKEAAGKVRTGYDKTVLTVHLKTGIVWAKKCKFYLRGATNDLLKLINE